VRPLGTEDLRQNTDWNKLKQVHLVSEQAAASRRVEKKPAHLSMGRDGMNVGIA
jgi:hypothetical protein